jgi:hypothetical protein
LIPLEPSFDDTGKLLYVLLLSMPGLTGVELDPLLLLPLLDVVLIMAVRSSDELVGVPL